MASGATATLGTTDSADESADETACVDSQSSSVHCEVLCFLQNKSKILPFDDLIAICGDFYSISEVTVAKNILERLISKRITNPKGTDSVKVKKLLIDILKFVLDSNVQLPIFYAVDLSRLPPVGIDHVDVSSILQELTSLRQEVRNMSRIREELDELKATLKSMPAVSNIEFPPLPLESCINAASKSQPLSAQLADELRDSEWTRVSRRTQPSLRTKAVTIDLLSELQLLTSTSQQ